MTRKMLALLLALLLAVPAWAFAGTGESILSQFGLADDAPESAREAGDGGAMYDVICQQQGFTTRCSVDYGTAWGDSSGLYIYTTPDQAIPYVLVYKGVGERRITDAAAFFSEVETPRMKEKYGDDLRMTAEYGAYTVGGRDMPAASYIYDVDGSRITMLRAVDVRENYTVSYIAKYSTLQSDEEIARTIRVLNEVAANFRSTDDGAAPAPKGEPAPTDMNGYEVTTARAIVTGLTEYSDYRFHVKLPEGWKILVTGDIGTFAFRAYDPKQPQRGFFYFSKLLPILKSQAAKQWYLKNGEIGGMLYTFYGDAPVMEYLTVPCFLNAVDDARAYTKKYASSGLVLDYNVFPDFAEVTVLDTAPSDIPCPPTCRDNSIARINYTTAGGEGCEGLVTAQPTYMGSLDMLGVDVQPDTVYNFMGVTAPMGELAELEPVLVECLSSFDFTEAYVRQSIAAMGQITETILAVGRQLSAAADSYNDAWSRRQTSYDIISQKTSDATLGYERLYDAETGEVYRAELGFYDSYDLHRDEFSNANLRLIDDSTSQYYLQGVDYYITR